MPIEWGLLSQGLNEPTAYEQNKLRRMQLQMQQQQLGMSQLQFETSKAAAQRANTFRSKLAKLGNDADPRAILKHMLTSDDPKIVEHAVAGLQDLDEADNFNRIMGFTPSAKVSNTAVAPVNARAQDAAAEDSDLINRLAADAKAGQKSLPPVPVDAGGRYVPTPLVDVNAARLASMRHPGRRAVGEAILKNTELDKVFKLDVLEQRLIEAGVKEDDPRFKFIKQERANLLAPTNADIREYEYGLENPAFVEHQLKLKEAGAPKVSVGVSTEKKYGEAFAGKVADSDILLRAAAEKAPEIADNSNRILSLLDSGQIITGAGANVRLQLAKALKLTGADDSKSIANTEALISALADSTLGAIKTSGLGTGQGFTDKDREFLERAKAGQITYEAASLRHLAELAHKAAAATADKWNSRVKQIPKSVIQGTGISTEPIAVSPITRRGKAASGGPVDVFIKGPDGEIERVIRFDSKEKADKFKREAKIKD